MSNPVDELKYCLPQKYWEKIECSDDVLDFAGDFINELQSEVERLRSIAQRLANGQDGTECKNRAYADLVVYNLEKKAEEKEANDE